MSYPEEGEEEQRRDLRTMGQKLPVAALEHMALPTPGSKEWERLQSEYPELEHPALYYSFLPDLKTAQSIYLELERSINWRWGSGDRDHTSSEVAEQLMVLTIIKMRLFGNLGGFERIQANSSTINQNVTQKEERRQRRSLNPFRR